MKTSVEHYIRTTKGLLKKPMRLIVTSEQGFVPNLAEAMDQMKHNNNSKSIQISIYSKPNSSEHVFGMVCNEKSFKKLL